MEKTIQIDKKIKKVTQELGMPLNAVRRIALLEYLKNHFEINIKSELTPSTVESSDRLLHHEP